MWGPHRGTVTPRATRKSPLDAVAMGEGLLPLSSEGRSRFVTAIAVLPRTPLRHWLRGKQARRPQLPRRGQPKGWPRFPQKTGAPREHFRAR